MRSHLLFAASAAALLALAACADSSTGPRSFDPGTLRKDVQPDPDGTCKGGYVLATRSDGTLVCVPG